MKRSESTQRPASAAETGVQLSAATMEHLRAALEQMDLLLKTRHVEVGMCYLLAMLQHMGAVKQDVR